MLGDASSRTWRVVDHDARDRASLVDLGMVGDVPVLLNREWVEADLRITTGFVEPHFFAGFSGGPKMVAPASPAWTRPSSCTTPDGSATHGPRGASSRATRSTTPSARSRRRPGVDFSLDVAPRRRAADHASVRRPGPGDARRRRARGAPRGDARGRRALRHRDHDQQRLPARPEPVPGGQGHVRGGRDRPRPAARSSVPPSAATASRTTASTRRAAATRRSPAELLERIAASPVTIPDQWQVQIQARVQAQGAGAGAMRRPGRRAGPGGPSRTGRRHRGSRRPACCARQPDARIGVLPQGPQTIAYVS